MNLIPGEDEEVTKLTPSQLPVPVLEIFMKDLGFENLPPIPSSHLSPVQKAVEAYFNTPEFQERYAAALEQLASEGELQPIIPPEDPITGD